MNEWMEGRKKGEGREERKEGRKEGRAEGECMNALKMQVHVYCCCAKQARSTFGAKSKPDLLSVFCTSLGQNVEIARRPLSKQKCVYHRVPGKSFLARPQEAQTASIDPFGIRGSVLASFSGMEQSENRAPTIGRVLYLPKLSQ